MVLEHVEDFDVVLRAMNRVLKPGGMVLSIFPDRSVWRQGHAGITGESGGDDRIRTGE
jgi:2-polyprenyl-3-methyl-5-hydroxy-6-metoxy-1,4-benzoquinol methylase